MTYEQLIQQALGTVSSGMTALSDEEYRQRRLDRLNAAEGDLDGGVDCPHCRNKGLVYVSGANGEVLSRECSCVAERRTNAALKTSGLAQRVARDTFGSFVTADEWQRSAKSAAEAFAREPEGWFLACGQVGSGKTHLCVAICGELIKRGRQVRYLSWRDDSARLKGLLNSPAYSAEVERLKNVDVLYIDDLFKTQKSGTVSAGDVNLAFELLNYRYNSPDLTTIISTERTLQELLDIDEGTASRIAEKTANGGRVIIQRDASRNYRLRA